MKINNEIWDYRGGENQLDKKVIWERLEDKIGPSISIRWRNIDKQKMRGMGTGLTGPKKLKRPNLALSSFKKGQILKMKKAK